jgi:Fe2+ transport system protein FeoA
MTGSLNPEELLFTQHFRHLNQFLRYRANMNLTDLEQNKEAVVISIRDDRHLSRLRSSGIRPGANIALVGRTSSRGFLVKVDDTRLVLGYEIAEKISCAYNS